MKKTVEFLYIFGPATPHELRKEAKYHHEKGRQTLINRQRLFRTLSEKDIEENWIQESTWKGNLQKFKIDVED